MLVDVRLSLISHLPKYILNFILGLIVAGTEIHKIIRDLQGECLIG